MYSVDAEQLCCSVFSRCRTTEYRTTLKHGGKISNRTPVPVPYGVTSAWVLYSRRGSANLARHNDNRLPPWPTAGYGCAIKDYGSWSSARGHPLCCAACSWRAQVVARCNTLQYTRSTLQHTATHCNTLQHTATHCNTLQHTATLCRAACSWWAQVVLHCNTLQHTATHCNTLQHTATHCHTLQHCAVLPAPAGLRSWHTATHCNTLHHTAPHCSTLQHTAAHCSTLQHTIEHCNTLQHTTTHCNTLQRTATHCCYKANCNTFFWHCDTQQNTAPLCNTHCNTMQLTATHCNTRLTLYIL